MCKTSYRAVRISAAIVLLCATVRLCSARDQSPAVPAAELVRRAIQNEIKSNSGPGLHFMFKDQKKTAHLSQTRLIVETRDATAGMLIEQDGRRLSPQQQQAEEARLEGYVRNPEELNKKRKQEKEDADRSARILNALPDAFIYQYRGAQPGTENVGHPGDELLKLNFRPNPNYVPPTRVEQVLTGMSGYLLIDAKQEHLAEIDGTLQKEVGFGWGILGHLDRGGRFLVQQADVGDRHWEVTRMELSFTGKILLIKKLSIRSSDIFSGFHLVPGDLSFAQGVELLKKAAREESAGTTGKQSMSTQTKEAQKIACGR